MLWRKTSRRSYREVSPTFRGAQTLRPVPKRESTRKGCTASQHQDAPGPCCTPEGTRIVPHTRRRREDLSLKCCTVVRVLWTHTTNHKESSFVEQPVCSHEQCSNLSVLDHRGCQQHGRTHSPMAESSRSPGVPSAPLSYLEDVDLSGD